MSQKILINCEMYILLNNRKGSSFAQSLSGYLIGMESQVASTLEYIKEIFPDFTEHGMQHSLRIIEYIYRILSQEMKDNLSDIEIFCFIMSAFFHDIGMTLPGIEDKENQRMNHHLYAKEPIEKYCSEYLRILPEYRRVCDCVSFVCEAHNRNIDDLYVDPKFKKDDSIQGQILRYGLLTILLRIGDLMDMEEGRTNEFYMHLKNPYYLNDVSIEHHERHLEIENYCYTPKKIKVEIKTKNRERYKIWKEWLKYLDYEIMVANSHYLSNIDMQQGEYYRFPGVEIIITPDQGANFLVEEIHFRVDDNGSLWDILTNAVYTHEFDYIRELIQNAIDANLLKYYIDPAKNIQYVSPRSWGISDTVVVIYSENKGMLVVYDQGIGMDETDIRNFLFKAAHSGYKYKKKRKEFEFPSIAKFGIGFVSCLTKASFIEIVSQANGSSLIRVEIEDKNTVAFIEKRPQIDTTGTLIRMTVKNKFSFDELKEYIYSTFTYPSIKIQLLDLDNLCIVNDKINYLDIDDNNINSYEVISLIINKAKNIQEKKELYLSKYLQDKTLHKQVIDFLYEDGNENNKLQVLKTMLSAVTHESMIKKNLEIYINQTNNNPNTKILSQIMKKCGDEINSILNEYPIFYAHIRNEYIQDITNYEFLNVELDELFNIRKIFNNDKKQRCKGNGILYIRTKIYNPNFGIEWQTVNGFLYNSGEIEKNLIRVSSNRNDSEPVENIISLNYIEDVEYEMDLLLEEEYAEDYYERTNRFGYHKDDSEVSKFDYDIVCMKKNDFYIIVDVDPPKIDVELSGDKIGNSSKLFNNIKVPSNYKGEQFEIENSRLYQDGILMNLNPQIIVPLGVGWSVCNLTADARFELNASRHEINMSRNIIDLWLDRYGKMIQQIVAKNCIQVFEDLKLDYSIENMMGSDIGNDYIDKRSYQNMKNVLKELLKE